MVHLFEDIGMVTNERKEKKKKQRERETMNRENQTT